MNLNLNELRDRVHTNALNKGFHEDAYYANEHTANDSKIQNSIKHAFFAQKIALVHTELSEAIEADRKDRTANLQGLESDIAFNSDHMPEAFIESFEALVKDTIEDELADAIIRILDIAGSMNIDIKSHVEYKIQYNETRNYKHGKNY